ncbi:MAG TPA: helix-turn-helix transcriptional regulator [Methylomirabilota bacterium]|nr:helix-turn-helix transcriptional regulator [Methylomirabilota bacterium]
MKVEELLEIVDRVYAAAQEPVLWPEALQPMAEMFGVRGVNLMFNDLGERPNGVMVNVGIDPDLVARYNAHYVTVDPVVEASLRVPPGGLFDSEELFERSWWRRTELYADLMDGYGLEHINGATLLQEKRGYGALSMLRGPEGRPLAGEEREAFLLLVRHVRRAIALHRRLAVAERRSGMLAELVDRLSVGVVLVDARGGVVHANGAAERIARLGDGFSLGRHGVAGASGSSSAALRALIGRAVETGCGGAVDGGGVVRLERPSNRSPLEVLVSPLGANRRGDGEPVAVVIVTDPEDDPPSPTDLLAQMYRLTPREAELAVELVSGGGLVEAAERLGVSVTTARSHLKAVFAKTGTSRQGELIRAVLRGPLGHLSWGGRPA